MNGPLFIREPVIFQGVIPGTPDTDGAMGWLLESTNGIKITSAYFMNRIGTISNVHVMVADGTATIPPEYPITDACGVYQGSGITVSSGHTVRYVWDDLVVPPDGQLLLEGRVGTKVIFFGGKLG